MHYLIELPKDILCTKLELKIHVTVLTLRWWLDIINDVGYWIKTNRHYEVMWQYSVKNKIVFLSENVSPNSSFSLSAVECVVILAVYMVCYKCPCYVLHVFTNNSKLCLIASSLNQTLMSSPSKYMLFTFT